MAKGFVLQSMQFSIVEAVPAAPGTSGAFVVNDFMGMVYRGDGSYAHVGAICDLGSPQHVDTVAVLGLLSTNSPDSVRVYAGNDPTFADSAFSADITPPAGEIRSPAGRHHALGLFGPVGPYRYWYVVAEGGGAVDPEIGRILIGIRVQPTYNFSYGLARGVRDLGDVEYGPRGAMLRRRARKLRTLGLSWQYVTKAEAESAVLPLLESVGTTECVLACIDPDPHEQRSRRMYFGTLQGDPSISWRTHDGWEKRLSLWSVI